MIESISPIRHSVAVTPHDTNNLSMACRALLVGVAGNVKVMYENGTVDTVYLAAGLWHGMYVLRVYSTDTAATGIHAGY
jgi:hypothetical protein